MEKSGREIKADTLLLDFVREKAAIASSADARPPTAAFVLYGWMESRCFPVQCWQPELTGMRSRLGGTQKESEEFADFLAKEGADQCGFCSPGLIMNVLAMERELVNPTMEEVREYLAGNLCRCTGYADRSEPWKTI